MLGGGIPSLMQAKRNQMMSRENQVVLLVIFRLIFVLSGVLGFTAVMLLLNYINDSSWDSSHLTFGYYFITITFGIAALIGLLRLFMRITFQDEEEEIKLGLRKIAKLIVFDESIENFEGEIRQRVTEKFKQYDVVSLFEEILNQLRDATKERNKLEIIAQPFIHTLDVENLKKCSSIVFNIGNPIKRSSAEKLVEIIATGLLDKKEENQTTKEKKSDKKDIDKSKRIIPTKIAKEDKKQKLSEITKKEIEIVRKLTENKDSVDILWIVEETGMSKTKIKLIALELDMEIKFDRLIKI